MGGGRSAAVRLAEMSLEEFMEKGMSSSSESESGMDDSKHVESVRTKYRKKKQSKPMKRLVNTSLKCVCVVFVEVFVVC